jgi:tRNA(Ile)-lysidine synthase
VDDFIQRVDQAIARHQLLADGETVVVGVSGGVDSMVLLHALHKLSAKHRWKLVVAHFNHQLRGDAADADACFVSAVAKKLGLRVESASGDVKVLARREKLSVEMAARNLRHEFLARTALKLGARRIALAHHADDQVELFFLRLLRGAGVQGLSGMKWITPSPVDRNVMLVRPLLEEWKEALIQFARAERIKFHEDATNRSTDILRNRIRHKLLPLLRRDYQPAINPSVLRSMELLRDENDFMAEEANQWIERKKRAPFNSLHVALQRRILQTGLWAEGIVPQFEHIEEMRLNPKRWINVRTDIFCRCTAGGLIEIRNVENVSSDSAEAVVLIGTRAGATAHESVRLSWKFRRGGKLSQRKAKTEFFDADAVGESIGLRHWRAGDRFQPIGMATAIKLQDFFTNLKIPKKRRHELLIATTARGEIFWVEGLRISERFKITTTTTRILQWSWRRTDSNRRCRIPGQL